MATKKYLRKHRKTRQKKSTYRKNNKKNKKRTVRKFRRVGGGKEMVKLEKLKNYIRDTSDTTLSPEQLKVFIEQMSNKEKIAEEEYIREHDMNLYTDLDDKDHEDTKSIITPEMLLQQSYNDKLEANLKKRNDQLIKDKQKEEKKYLINLQKQISDAENKLKEQMSQCEQVHNNDNTIETIAKYCDGIKTTQDEIAKYTSQLPSRY